MPFPEVPRVIYGNNPLVEVICQLQFPAILKIDHEKPFEFQDLIRDEYPLYEEKLQLLPEELRKIIPDVDARIGNKAYAFSSDDKTWAVSLTQNFLAMVCKDYQRWETYRDHFIKPLEILLQVYHPAFFTRIGLRYRNVIQRSRLNLEGCKWSDLIQPYIAGELASDDIEADIQGVSRETLIRLRDEGGYVRMRHGIERTSAGEDCYLIDNDFYTDQKVEVQHAIATLDRLNKRSGHLFQWCIQRKLHEALGPQPL